MIILASCRFRFVEKWYSVVPAFLLHREVIQTIIHGVTVKKRNEIIVIIVAACLLSILLPLSPCFAYKSGSATPSCHDDIAATKTEAGTSPDCSPVIYDRERSLEILNGSGAKKINGKWYIFISAAEFEGTLDIPSRWKTISLLISAVESMFNEQAECFLVRIPETDKDKEDLLTGNYPQRLIAASAKPVELPAEEKSSKKWPEYHHPLLYTITVYQLQKD